MQNIIKRDDYLNRINDKKTVKGVKVFSAMRSDMMLRARSILNIRQSITVLISVCVTQG